MFLIRVLNKRFGHTGEYIGRPSPLGNPFPLRQESDRDLVISKYGRWLKEKIESDEDNPQKQEIRRLAKILVDTGNLDLVCWCKPKRCHGDVIANVVKRVVERQKRE